MEKIQSVGITAKTPLNYIEKLATNCEKCGHCCKYGSGYFMEDDIVRVSSHLNLKKEDFKKDYLKEKELFNAKIHSGRLNKKDGMPYGSCVFYNEKEGCTIHEIKPLHCRLSMGCGEYGQHIAIWFTLNFIVNPNDPEAIRQWSAYLKTHPTIPGGELTELVPDKEKLNKMLNYELLR